MNIAEREGPGYSALKCCDDRIIKKSSLIFIELEDLGSDISKYINM